VTIITIANAGTLTRIGTPAICGAVSSSPWISGFELSSAGAIAGGEPHRQGHADSSQQRREVVAPRDRNGDVAHRVFEDQIPPDDPGDDLAERRVGVRVRTTRLRDHRRQFRVAERGQRTGRSKQHEREHERRPCAIPHDLAGRCRLPCRCRPDRAEDARADHRTDRQHDQIAGAEHALERLLAGLRRLQFRYRFAREQLRHHGSKR
jgi:hypothetical protein